MTDTPDSTNSHLVDIEVPVVLLFRAPPDTDRLGLAQFVENVMEHSTVGDAFHTAVEGADVPWLAYDGYSVPGVAPVRFTVGDVEAALRDEDGDLVEMLIEYTCLEFDSPGQAIEEIVANIGNDRGAIVSPDGYRILVDVHTSDSDPDMVLVRVSGPGAGSWSTYSQDWDSLVPRSFLGAAMTVELLTDVLESVVDEANRAMEAAGL